MAHVSVRIRPRRSIQYGFLVGRRRAGGARAYVRAGAGAANPPLEFSRTRRWSRDFTDLRSKRFMDYAKNVDVLIPRARRELA